MFNIIKVLIIALVFKNELSYEFASLEECKSTRAFAQLQFAVRSRGERSRLQQGDDSHISSFHFLILIPLILFAKFDDGI